MKRINEWINLTLDNAANSIGKFLMVDRDGNSRTFDMENNTFYTVRKVHGYFAFTDVVQVINVAASGTWYHVTNGTNTLFANIQTNAGILLDGDEFEITATPVAGYRLHLRVDFKLQGIGGNNKNWELEIYNVTQARSIPVRAKDNSEGVQGVMSLTGLAYDLQADFGDKYILRIRNTSDTTNFTAQSGAVFLEVSHLTKI